jgi:hypothetical protein
MKILTLSKGEPAYLRIPEDSNISMDNTVTKQKGYKFVLVKVT